MIRGTHPVRSAVVHYLWRFLHGIAEVAAELHRLDVQSCHDHLREPFLIIGCPRKKECRSFITNLSIGILQKIAFSPSSKSVLTLQADPLKWLLTNSLWSWGEVNNILRCFSLSVMFSTTPFFSDYDDMSTWKVNIFHADMSVCKSNFGAVFEQTPPIFHCFLHMIMLSK